MWHDGNSARPPTIANGLVYIANWEIDADASIIALDAATGVEQWRSSDGGNSAIPVIAGTTLYTTRSDGGVYAIDRVTGDTIWQVNLGAPQTSDLAIADGAIIVMANGSLLAIGGSEAEPGTPVATPLTDGDASGLPACTSPLSPIPYSLFPRLTPNP